jgi:hypothetical protein
MTKVKNILNSVKKTILVIILLPYLLLLSIIMITTVIAKGMFADPCWKERQDWIDQAD